MEAKGGDLLKVIEGERRDVGGVEKAVAVVRRGQPAGDLLNLATFLS